MTAHDIQKSIKEGVENAIKTGTVKMKSKAYFITKGVLLAVGLGVVALLVIYMVSLVFFALRVKGVWFTPVFGTESIGPFLTAVPWILVLVVVLFIGLLELLVKKYSFGYRNPLLYSALGVIVFVFLTGFLVAKTTFHRAIYERAQDNRLPIAGPLYRGLHPDPKHEVHPGRVVEINEKGFTLEIHTGDILDVIVSSRTRLPLGSNYEAGDTVIVLGDLEMETLVLDARGVRVITEELPGRPFREFRQKKMLGPPPQF